MSVGVELQHIDASLGRQQILHDISLEIQPGQLVTLLGPSGSGKTTTLNVVAGFVKQRSGSVRFDGRPMDGVPVGMRNIGIVFQSYALFPHMTVAENLDFPLRARKLPPAERRRRIEEILALVHLHDYGSRRVGRISGGQQQRVALARALVYQPSVLLLDEPLAALDKHLRETMQTEIKRIQREVGSTTIAVTHDQAEALTMSDVVVILRDGRVEQAGAPQDVYHYPQTMFAAQFLGEANLLPIHEGHVPALDESVAAREGHVLIRPEDFHIAEDSEGHSVQIEELTFQGSRHRARVRLADGTLAVASLNASDLAGISSSTLRLACDVSAAHVVPPSAKKAEVSPGPDDETTVDLDNTGVPT